MADLSGKRLLLVITKSNWGGAQSYVFTLAQHFHAEGLLVTVALGGTGQPGSETGMLAERLAKAGIRVRVLSSLAREVSLVHEWRALGELVSLLKEERPDILHLNSSKAGVLGALAGRFARVPRIVFTAHGWPHREPRGFFMRMIIWLGSWFTVVLAHTVIAVSACDYRTAPVLFLKRKVAVIRNGMKPFLLRSRGEARHFLAPGISQLAKLEKWIVIPAELTHNKGIDVAIKAFAGVSTNIDSSALVIIGEGAAHVRLAELIEAYHLKKRVFLLGFVPDVRQYLAAADIFLMPSRKEGFPLALLEAGHASLPVIASRVGGIPEIVEHEKSGLLIAPDDIDMLADALTRLLTRTDEAAAFGTALNQTVQQRFSEEEMLARTAEEYQG